MGTKREREPRGSTRKSKKRQKVEAPANGAIAESDRILGIDELEWKAVQLPDRLDDAGGFFGLEEIEGVDIVRPQGSGEVKFKVCLRNKLLRFSGLHSEANSYSRVQEANP